MTYHCGIKKQGEWYINHFSDITRQSSYRAFTKRGSESGHETVV